MKIPSRLSVALFSLCAALGAGASERAAKPLPGEDGRRVALAPDPFPDRMSAYVWRNWGLVDSALLAETVGASKGELAAIAADMGLDPDASALPEWKTKGYITVLRRNWHLLPYGQLMKLLEKTREELDFCLMEDDFLWVKLGSVKPFCEPLSYNAADAAAGRAARLRIAETLRGEGLDPKASEEPRFSFIREIMATQKDSARRGASEDSPFDFRLIFSYFADYGDPLGDPDVGSYPDGLLEKLAADGVNAVWLHTVLRKGPEVPGVRRRFRESDREPEAACCARREIRHQGVPLHERTACHAQGIL